MCLFFTTNEPVGDATRISLALCDKRCARFRPISSQAQAQLLWAVAGPTIGLADVDGVGSPAESDLAARGGQGLAWLRVSRVTDDH